jgi:hypothetical protein
MESLLDRPYISGRLVLVKDALLTSAAPGCGLG